MEQEHSINLFQRTTAYSPALSLIDRYLGMVRFFLLGGVILISAVTIGVYAYTKVTVKKLEQERTVLVTSLTGGMPKEVMLLALRARILSLKNILQYQVSIAPYIDTTLSLAQPPVLTSFAIADKNTVTISISLRSINEAIALFEKILMLHSERKIVSPVLTSLSVDKDGAITMGLMYSVVLIPSL